MTQGVPIDSSKLVYRLIQWLALCFFLVAPVLAAAAEGDIIDSDFNNANSSTPLERVERFRCLPAGLCETCAPDQAQQPSCSAFGHHRPLTCISLTPIEPESEDSEALDRRSLEAESSAQLLLNATSADAHDLFFAPSANEHTTVFVQTQQHHQSKRDFFWSGHETPAGKAARIIAKIDWDAVREGEARSQGVRDQGVRFHSYAPCARVISKERSDFGEFVLCNIVLAILALLVLFTRHRKLAMRQYVRLAARIGIPGAMV